MLKASGAYMFFPNGTVPIHSEDQVNRSFQLIFHLCITYKSIARPNKYLLTAIIGSFDSYAGPTIRRSSWENQFMDISGMR